MKVNPATAVRLVNGRLDLSHPEALNENPTADRAPRGARWRYTPRIRIPDLLAEVQNWTGFTSHSTRAPTRTQDGYLQQHLNAALLASP